MAGPRRIDIVDVSSMNTVDWTKIADDNITVGILRYREFSTAAKQDDPLFRTWWPQIRNAGLIRGAFLLLDPALNATRAQIQQEAQNFTQAIDAVGGLEPGDLPLSVDFEQVGQNPPPISDCLNQLAWLLNELTPYVRTQMRRADALPLLYTGRNTWINLLQDHGGAFTTTDPVAADRITIDFSTFPLWWAWLATPTMDPGNATQMAMVRSPAAWRGATSSILLQYTDKAAIPQHEAEDGSVVANLDAAGAVTLSTDFTPVLSLARVAPPPADVELTRVTQLSDQPPDQVFRLLLIGQGFWEDEFAQIVEQALFGVGGQRGIVDIAPLNLLAASAGKNALACYFDAGTHADGTGLSLPLRQEKVGNATIDQMRIGHPGLDAPQVLPAGRTLAEYLAHLTVKLADGTVHRATEYWPVGTRCTGARGALIAVLRRAPFQTHNPVGNATPPPDPARHAELYQLDPTTDDQIPFVAVNVVSGDDWPLVLARAIAQNLAGLTDEYELEGTSFAQPGEGVLSPIAPNVMIISDTQKQSLIGGTAAASAVPEVFSEWRIPGTATVDFVQHTSATANPILAWDGVTQTYALGDFHLVEGGAGFRTDVLRCDKDCLMRRIPAAVSNTVEKAPTPAPTLPIQSPLRVFCKVCEQRLRTVIVGRTAVKLTPRVEIDTQRRLFDSLVWNGNPITALNTVTLATTVSTTGPTWTCTAEFAPSTGFRFTNVNLANVDYWVPGSQAHIAHVLDSVTFDGFEVDYVDGTTDTFRLTDALASTAKPPPTFRAFAAGDSHGRYQVGACLLVSWQKNLSTAHSYILDAELSLVLAAMDNNVDPAGIMMGCCIFPQLAMRVRRITSGTKAIKALRGAITLNANNADASNLTGALGTIATGKLTTSLFCESNRASAGGGTGGGAALDSRKRAAFAPPAGAPANRLLPPPHWSWIYDYCNAGITTAVTFVAAYSRSDGAKGTTARDQVKAWPANQTATSESIHKVPRQAVYDSLCIHPDRGNDAAGQPVVTAPYCADLGLLLHWRHGVSLSGGPAPLHVPRGWGAGRLGQGARTVIGAPEVPPNHHVSLTVTPQSGRAEVAVKYAVVADEFAPERWQVFLEQGLAYTFQYAVENTLGAGQSGVPFAQLGWLAQSMGADVMKDVVARLTALIGQPAALDQAVRDLWLSILRRVRRFDATADGSTEQQVPDGPSDVANLENV
jgi:GH25 family lysozyme M1 (1,4-beta-N-acetylmuramidase)